MQTFEEYWKEYCAKHKMVENGPMMRGIKHIVEDAWNAASAQAYTKGYDAATDFIAGC